MKVFKSVDFSFSLVKKKMFFFFPMDFKISTTIISNTNFLFEIQKQQIKLNNLLNKIENFDIEENSEDNLSSSPQEGDNTSLSQGIFKI
jgi:hypothetical protein